MECFLLADNRTMDVGSADFRFTKLQPGENRDEREGKPWREPSYVELHVDSLDRYHDIPGGVNTTQYTAKLVNPQVGRADFTPQGNNFLVNTKNYLLNGYFTRIGIAQIQLYYRVPTVVKGVNDTLAFLYGPPPGTVTAYTVTIPQGYYNLTTLAAALQGLIRTATANAGFTVATNALTGGLTFATNNANVFAFQPAALAPLVWTEAQNQLYYRTARMLGAARITYGFPTEVAPVTVFQTSVDTFSPDLLYTDYIDIVSSTLNQFKRVKDTNSTDIATSDVIARIYLNPQDTSQNVGVGSTLGTFSFVITTAFKNVNWCKWSPEQALESIDIELLDMFGQRLPWSTAYNTEFSMTLLASET
jgi:hypothetical protein